MDVKVVSLSKGFDPDLFVREKGIDKLKENIEKAVNLFDYKLNLLKARFEINSPEGKAKIAQEMLLTISKVKNEVLKSSYLKKLADILSVREEALLSELKKIKDDSVLIDYERFSADKTFNLNAVERMIVKLILEEEGLIEQTKEKLEINDFHDPFIRKIICSMIDLNSKGKKIEVNRLMSYFDDETTSQTLTQICFSEECKRIDKQKAFNDCVNRIKQEGLKSKRLELRSQIKAAESQGDKERLKELIKEYNYLIKG
jgi:DNA primase